MHTSVCENMFTISGPYRGDFGRVVFFVKVGVICSKMRVIWDKLHVI